MGGHGHGHHRHHGGDFDWEAMADKLEVDGAFVLPLVGSVVGDLTEAGHDPASVAHVVDVGCGPGVVTCALAEHFQAATVTGLDTSAELLSRLRLRAGESGLDTRVHGVVGDLEQDLPQLGPADIVWASMVVHHVDDPAATLHRLCGLLRPGGALVLIEFGGNPRVLPDHDPLVARGTWQRLEDAATASLERRLEPGMIGRDWSSDLTGAGLTDVTDRFVAFRYEAPLEDLPRRWLVRHVRRGLGMAEALPADDTAALVAFAAAVENGDRTDPFVVADRRVLMARRPD